MTPVGGTLILVGAGLALLLALRSGTDAFEVFIAATLMAFGASVLIGRAPRHQGT